MTSAPEPGSPAAIDEARRDAEYRADEAERKLRYMKERRDEKLLIMASVIASGLIDRVLQPGEVAAQSLDVALHILKAVEALP